MNQDIEQEPTIHPTNQRISFADPTDHPLAFHLTVETALWILVVAVALALRLSHLDAAPLNSHEAREAVFAWRAVTGQGMPETSYSPLLFSANALLFTLCGTSDKLARLWPALCGSALALTPYLLRRYIGRVGALATGLCLAFSPTLLFASRQLNGAIIAAFAGMIILGSLARFFDDQGGKETGDRTWLALAAGGLALAVTSSASAYGLLLALGVTLLNAAWVWPNGELRRLWMLLKPHLRFVSVVLLFSGLVFSTAFGWNLAGLGAVGDLFADWVARFRLSSGSSVSPLALLAVYELFVLFFGLGGLVWAIRRGHRFGALMGMWAGVGALLLLLMPDRAELDILWILLPLTMLAGIAIEQLARGLWERGSWLSEGLHIPVVALLWIHFYLMLARYAVSASPVEQNTSLALALLTVALQGLLTLIFALGLRFDAALRSAAVGAGLALLAMMLSTGWGVAYVRPADPREILVQEATAPEVRDLVQTLRDTSWREIGLPQTLPFALRAEPDSVLAWYLRDFTARKSVGGVGTASVLITAQRGEVPSAISDEYVGQDFALHRSWDFSDVACIWGWPPQCHSLVAWWLSRNTLVQPEIDQHAVFWIVREQINATELRIVITVSVKPPETGYF